MVVISKGADTVVGRLKRRGVVTQMRKVERGLEQREEDPSILRLEERRADAVTQRLEQEADTAIQSLEEKEVDSVILKKEELCIGAHLLEQNMNYH